MVGGALSLIGIIEVVCFGFFMGIGWWVANRILSKIFG